MIFETTKKQSIGPSVLALPPGRKLHAKRRIFD